MRSFKRPPIECTPMPFEAGIAELDSFGVDTVSVRKESALVD
jgi:hypothetical protein